jgi:Uma2 family endonuclease
MIEFTSMSTITPSLPSAAGLPAANGQSSRPDVVVENKLTIPGWIDSLEDYRRWAASDAYPQSGWVSYLNGTISVDTSMEEFVSHNRVKQAFNFMFGGLFTDSPVGSFVPDRMLLVNAAANLSTEPDGLFYLWATMQAGRLRLIPGMKSGFMQLEGAPDGVLEIVSDGSEDKDLKTLRDLYWKAQIPEYWLVDARSETVRFDILRHTKDGYESTASESGWLKSEVLTRSFRIERLTDPLGLSQFVVHVRSS